MQESELKKELMKSLPELTEDDFAYHATDLYVVGYMNVVNWLKKNYRHYDNITTFVGQEDSGWNGAGQTCLDIPFAGNWNGWRQLLK